MRRRRHPGAVGMHLWQVEPDRTHPRQDGLLLLRTGNRPGGQVGADGGEGGYEQGTVPEVSAFHPLRPAVFRGEAGIFASRACAPVRFAALR